MTLQPLTLEIEDLTPEEANLIWKRQTKRAPNFGEFLTALNVRKVGASFRVKVGGDDSAEKAKELRRNFNEAAKERTAYVTVDVQAPPANATPGTIIKSQDGRDVTLGSDGKWFIQKPEPVVLRFKNQTVKEKRRVVDDKTKKQAEIEVDVIASMEILLIASEAVQTRRPRTESEDVTALATGAPADAKKGAKYTLSDGRVAIRTQAGKWRAPKLAASSTDGVEGTGIPGTNGATGNNGSSVETPALVGAA